MNLKISETYSEVLKYVSENSLVTISLGEMEEFIEKFNKLSNWEKIIILVYLVDTNNDDTLRSHNLKKLFIPNRRYLELISANSSAVTRYESNIIDSLKTPEAEYFKYVLGELGDRSEIEDCINNMTENYQFLYVTYAGILENLYVLGKVNWEDKYKPNDYVLEYKEYFDILVEHLELPTFEEWSS